MIEIINIAASSFALIAILAWGDYNTERRLSPEGLLILGLTLAAGFLTFMVMLTNVLSLSI